MQCVFKENARWSHLGENSLKVNNLRKWLLPVEEFSVKSGNFSNTFPISRNLWKKTHLMLKHSAWSVITNDSMGQYLRGDPISKIAFIKDMKQRLPSLVNGFDNSETNDIL